MHYPLTKRFACSVCGVDGFRHEEWFLVVENRWLDQLRILNWHASLAARQGFKSACGQQHLKILIAHWLEQASLRLPPHTDEPIPVTSDSGRDDASFCAGARLVGELSVFRDAFSRVWTGSPATLDAIVDALIPAQAAENQVAPTSKFFRPVNEPRPGLCFP